MTTTAQQNTVLSPATQIAEVVVVERCEQGAGLMRTWRVEYDTWVHAHANRDEGWINVFGRGYMPYLRHRLNCFQCANYETKWYTPIKTGE